MPGDRLPLVPRQPEVPDQEVHLGPQPVVGRPQPAQDELGLAGGHGGDERRVRGGERVGMEDRGEAEESEEGGVRREEGQVGPVLGLVSSTIVIVIVIIIIIIVVVTSSTSTPPSSSPWHRYHYP